MPKKLVAVAVRQPVLQDYEEEPIPEGHVRVKSRSRRERAEEHHPGT